MDRRDGFIPVVLDEKAKELLIEKGYDPQYGARPMRRAVERYLEADREAELDRLIVAAYTARPQTEPWGEAAAERLVREEPW